MSDYTSDSRETSNPSLSLILLFLCLSTTKTRSQKRNSCNQFACLRVYMSAYLTLGSGSHLMNTHTYTRTRDNNNKQEHKNRQKEQEKEKEWGVRRQFRSSIRNTEESIRPEMRQRMFLLLLPISFPLEKGTQSIDCLSPSSFPSSSEKRGEKRGHFHTQESLHYRLVRLSFLSHVSSLTLHWVPTIRYTGKDLRTPPLLPPLSWCRLWFNNKRLANIDPFLLLSRLWNTRTVQEHRGNGNGTDNTGCSKMPS